MTEQLTLSPFRECFSNLKSLNLVIGSSLLPVCLNCSHLCILDTLLTQCFHWYAVFPSSQTIDFLWYFFTIPGPRVFFYSVPQHPGVGLQVVFYPIGVESTKSTKSSKSLCAREMYHLDNFWCTLTGEGSLKSCGVCVCVCVAVWVSAEPILSAWSSLPFHLPLTHSPT